MKLRSWLSGVWLSYRRRFLPWVIFNMKTRDARSVEKSSVDHARLSEEFTRFISALSSQLLKSITDTSDEQPFAVQHMTASFKRRTDLYHKKSVDVMRSVLGFTLVRKPSRIQGAGNGVFIDGGLVKKGSIVAIYPGLIYEPGDPVLLQSIYNKFVFRCSDGFLVDGNDRGLSKIMYRSCAGRDIVSGHLMCDLSWLSDYPINPLSVGQYVNNHCSDKPGFEANVCYEEFDLPVDFSPEYYKFIPYDFYSADNTERGPKQRRVVAIVSLREIHSGEELYSNYMTIIKQ